MIYNKTNLFYSWRWQHHLRTSLFEIQTTEITHITTTRRNCDDIEHAKLVQRQVLTSQLKMFSAKQNNVFNPIRSPLAWRIRTTLEDLRRKWDSCLVQTICDDLTDVAEKLADAELMYIHRDTVTSSRRLWTRSLACRGRSLRTVRCCRCVWWWDEFVSWLSIGMFRF